MMNKNDFIAELKKELNGLPDSDIQRSIDFYTEMIEDKIEDGMTEENAVSELEPPAEIAKKVLSETSISKLVKAKLKPSRELKGWEIALLVLGAPLWLPLIIAFAAVLLSVYAVIWSVIISLYCIDLSFAVCVLGGTAQGIIFAFGGNVVSSVFYFGASIACFGIAVLLFFAFGRISGALVSASRHLVLKTKSMFIKKEAI